MRSISKLGIAAKLGVTGAAMAAAALAGAGVASAGVPTVSVTPSTGITYTGQNVSVSWTGFSANTSGFAAQCSQIGTTLYCGTPVAVTTSGAGTGSTTLWVQSNFTGYDSSGNPSLIFCEFASNGCHVRVTSGVSALKDITFA